MAPDNPVGDDDAGTVTTSTAPASSTLAATLPSSPPPPAPSPAPPAEPHAHALPDAARPPLPTSSGLEPAASTSSTSTSTPPAAPATAAAVAAATSPITIPDAAAPAAEAVPGGHLNGTAAAQPSSTATDTDMSNHLLLLGRPAAATAASHPSPSSHPAGYRTDSQPQAPAAPSTTAPAPPSSSTAPTTQFASYATASTSQTVDAQRPVHSNGPNAVKLPSMRTIDAMTQQPPLPSGAHPHAINGPLQPASPSGSQSYYAHAAVGATPGYGLHAELSRYPLPHDPRLPGTRASKKEIKRRTKTGCLTCRKRRIKCDEAHPTCNNCKKSKRECMGYDPIFRQQPPAQPGSIQPAPSPTASLPSSNSPGSVAGNGRQIHSYTAQPILPTSYSSNTTPPTATASPTPNTAYHSTSVAAAHSAASAASDTRYEYSSSVNPASRAYQPTAAFDPARHVDHTVTNPLDHRLPEPAPKMKVHQIIESLGPTPTPPKVPASEETFSEITKVYHEMYAAPLASFFETTWYYFAENGIMSFPKYPPLLEQMASFLKVLEAVKANDPTQMTYSGILETRIVWELACTAFQTPERSNASMRVNLPPEGDSAEARSRLQVVDTLLCGEYLPNNPLSRPVDDSDAQRARQFDFWYNLADFIRHRENPESSTAQQAREEVLGRMRRLLDGRENRDVLYSIAVVRHLSPNFGPNYGSSQPGHLDETDPKNRLTVASRFLLDEAQVTGGTTNVVRRITDIACRAFVNPGVNIAKRA